jgi:hypothetical protein
MIVNGTGGASLCFSGVEIEFVSAMNSAVFILGGKVTLEGVKIDNQLGRNWVSSLVYSHSNTSTVTVNLHSCTITNSNYSAYLSDGRSAVVYFANKSTPTQSVALNMTFCLCRNSTFDLIYPYNEWGGGFGYFYSDKTTSSIYSLFFVFFF